MTDVNISVFSPALNCTLLMIWEALNSFLPSHKVVTVGWCEKKGGSVRYVLFFCLITCLARKHHHTDQSSPVHHERLSQGLVNWTKPQVSLSWALIYPTRCVRLTVPGRFMVAIVIDFYWVRLRSSVPPHQTRETRNYMHINHSVYVLFSSLLVENVEDEYVYKPCPP